MQMRVFVDRWLIWKKENQFSGRLAVLCTKLRCEFFPALDFFKKD